MISGNAKVYGDANIYDGAKVYGNAIIRGEAVVCGNACLCSNEIFIKGRFIGGSDESRITEITNKTGNNFWAYQYVLGKYEIKSTETNKEKLLREADELIKKAEELREQANQL